MTTCNISTKVKNRFDYYRRKVNLTSVINIYYIHNDINVNLGSGPAHVTEFGY